MRLLVQRVTQASVDVAGERIAEIGAGLLVLAGVTHTDSAADAEALARKVHSLRILRDGRAAEDSPGTPILVVSQFTLYGSTRKGRRPSWAQAAPREVAEPIIDAFVAALRSLGADVATGRFGADMAVESVNDGPVSLVVER